MTTKHPLDDTFDIDRCDGEPDYDNIIIELPTDPELKNLDLIIKLALDAYKEQMEDLSHIEPKNRSKYLEIAERFLNQAKDAIDRKEKNRIQALRSQPKTSPAASGGVMKPNVPVPNTGVSRSDLADRMRLIQNPKVN